MIIRLIIHSVFHLGCNDPKDFEEGDFSAYCPGSRATGAVLLFIVSLFFISYTLYCYSRLYTILRGSREYNLWKAYIVFTITMFSIWNLTHVVIAVTGMTNQVERVSSIHPSRPRFASILRITRAISIGIGGGGGQFVSVFLFYKMLQIIFKTSSKVSKLKRTVDCEFVTKLHRKFIIYIILSVVATVLQILGAILLESIFDAFIFSIWLLILLNFLREIRDGIRELDDRVLQDDSVSEGVENKH
jgi:hypothetical protein